MLDGDVGRYYERSTLNFKTVKGGIFFVDVFVIKDGDRENGKNDLLSSADVSGVGGLEGNLVLLHDFNDVKKRKKSTS